MSKIEKETRSFKLHRKALRDIIERQAGTLEKAALEAVMNSIEAEASVVKIDTDFNEDHKHLSIGDNGRGIPTKEELHQHFETFGTPHQASEGKKWAQFRMGRGQCFAQGKNVWRTCGWKMETDVRSDFEADRDPEYILENGQEYLQGCCIDIDLYPDKYQGTVERLKSLITEQIEFVSVDVLFNGDKVNRDPSTLNWTHEDSDAYYLFGHGTNLIIYNLGVRCQTIPASIAGVVGVIVSKEQLKVNFARNEVLTDCSIMQRINKVIKANRQKKTRKSQRRLEAWERVAALQDLRDGEIDYDEIKSLGLFYTSSGRSLSFRDILNIRSFWSFCEHGNQVGDKLMQSGQAFCLDQTTIEELGYNGDAKEFFSWLTRSVEGGPKWDKVENLWRPFDRLREGFSETAVFIPRDKWTKLERRMIRVLEGLPCWGGRSFVMGISEAYNAWTDGETFIAIDRKFAKQHSLSSVYSAAGFFSVLVHECAHDCRTDESHCHGEAFYRNFHNLAMYGSINVGGDEYDYREYVPPGGAFAFLQQFCDRMKRAVQEERHAEAVQREAKAEARKNKALGDGKTIAASPKASKPSGGLRKIPRGVNLS